MGLTLGELVRCQVAECARRSFAGIPVAKCTKKVQKRAVLNGPISLNCDREAVNYLNNQFKAAGTAVARAAELASG
jgi:hypothetical protein